MNSQDPSLNTPNEEQEVSEASTQLRSRATEAIKSSNRTSTTNKHHENTSSAIDSAEIKTNEQTKASDENLKPYSSTNNEVKPNKMQSDENAQDKQDEAKTAENGLDEISTPPKSSSDIPSASETAFKHNSDENKKNTSEPNDSNDKSNIKPIKNIFETGMLYRHSIEVIDDSMMARPSISFQMKRFTLKFGETIIETDSSSNLFQEQKTVSNEAWKVFINGDKVEMRNLPIPIFMSIYDFRLVVARIFMLHVSAIEISYPHILYDNVYDLYEQNTSIGQARFKIIVHESSQPRENGYEKQVWPTYSKFIERIQLMKRSDIKFQASYKEFQYLMWQEKNYPVDIIELFNSHHTYIHEPSKPVEKVSDDGNPSEDEETEEKTSEENTLDVNQDEAETNDNEQSPNSSKNKTNENSNEKKIKGGNKAKSKHRAKSSSTSNSISSNDSGEIDWRNHFQKIGIHSFRLNELLNDSQDLRQYVKSSYPTIKPFYELQPYKNSCTFLINAQIDDHLRLFQLGVLENGNVQFIFKITSIMMTFDEIKSKLDKWMSKHGYKILEALYLDEFVYDPKFKLENYHMDFINCSSTVFIPTKGKGKSIPNVSKIVDMPGFTQIFATKSSFRFTTPQFLSKSSLLLFNMMSVLENYLTLNSNLRYANKLQINQADDVFYTYIDNVSSYEQSCLIYLFILGILNLTDEVKVSNTSDDLLANLRRITGKQKLTMLKELDPITFGNRFLQSGESDYSQLVQSNDQRPCILSKSEYDHLKLRYPDRVLNLENQSTHARMYLACPYDKFPISNYHSMPGQLCVVKCTMKFTSTHQFSFCDQILGGQGNKKALMNKFRSNTIVIFGTAIAPGRKCLLPTELFNLFVDYVLQKGEPGNPYYHIDKKYGKKAFIIERDEKKSSYKILTEFDPGFDHVLVITVTDSPDWFVAVNSTNNEPLTFNEKTENAFLRTIIEKSKHSEEIQIFINFIEQIIDHKFGNQTPLQALQELIKMKVQFICLSLSEIVVAIIYKGKVWFTPHLFNPGVEKMDIGRAVEKLVDLPTFKDLKPEGITELYQNYIDGKICAAKYFNTIVLIKPEKIKANTWPTTYIDLLPFIFNLYGLQKEPLTKSVIRLESLAINQLLTKFLRVCTQLGWEKDRKRQLLDIMKPFHSSKNQIEYLGSTDIVSWRRSKFHLDFLLDMTDESILRQINEDIMKSIQLKYDVKNEYFYRGNIY